ncbi:MAG: DUF5684 domain-containing protein [Spirochaetes bacterium]|jgi:hypothetical protein|nr:DUF5684 domain-containing protein [Spirochaetota bacterium]
MNGSQGPVTVAIIIYLAVLIVLIAGWWKVFTKAGKPGWAILIPIYNIIVMLEVVNRPLWWIILLFIPIVNFVVLIMIVIDLAKSFGKSTGFGILTIFFPFICIPILGFGKDNYTQISR